MAFIPSSFNKLWPKFVVILICIIMLFGLLLLPLTWSNLKHVFTSDNKNLSLVYSVFHEQFDEIYLSSSEGDSPPRLLAQIGRFTSHSITHGSGIYKNKITYIAVPTKSKKSTLIGTLWVLDLTTGERTVLATDADPTSPPQWLDDGDTLLYKRVRINRQELITINLESRIKKIIFSESFAQPQYGTNFGGVYPVGQDATNNIIFAKLTPSGTDVLAVNRISKDTTNLFHASNEFARDFSLSPSKTQLSYLVAMEQFERLNYQTVIYDLNSGKLTTYTSDSYEQFSPKWVPRTDLLSIGRINMKNRSGAVILFSEKSLEELPPPKHGFDVPISWSPDGRYLSIKNYSGTSGLQPGSSSLMIIDRNLGTRTLLESASETTVVGWWSND